MVTVKNIRKKRTKGNVEMTETLKDSLREWKEIVNFVRGLDDQQIEEFIQTAKEIETVHNEEKFREILYEMRKKQVKDGDVS